MEKSLRIISVYMNVENYIKAVKSINEPDYRQLWIDHVIEPSWKEWAAGQFNEERIRKDLERPLIDTDMLQEALQYMKRSNVEDIVAKANEAAEKHLPSQQFDRAICIMVNYKLGEDVNGVVGTCVGDNMLLQINPFIEGWQQYISWVIAHEHHHCAWGYDYFFIKGNKSIDLLTAVLNEGQADAFANSICSELNPAWINALDSEEEKQQWSMMQKYLKSPCNAELHIRFFFGDKGTDTPPFTGYTIGFRIIQAFRSKHPMVSFERLLKKSSKEILERSGYGL